MIRVKSLTQTCEACPAQWEGHLIDGRMVYVRYRWGYLSVSVSPEPTDDVCKAVDGDEVYGAELGNEFDGTLTYEDLKAATGHVVEWPL